MDDFGVLFFSEWDFTQWNLTWNMLANCIQLYLKFGVVQAPGERLQQRKLRQEIGETIISWADEYFSSEEHCRRTPRKEIYDNFCNYDPQQRKYITSTAFKDKIKNTANGRAGCSTHTSMTPKAVCLSFGQGRETGHR